MSEQTKILEYWNQPEVESMYDKNLLKLEIEFVQKMLQTNKETEFSVLDVGCGEGEGTLAYAEKFPQYKIDALDFSPVRLGKAQERLKNCPNVTLQQVDFLEFKPTKEYDFVISQRFLINLPSWDLQKQAILTMERSLKNHGQLILIEGSEKGASKLNYLRLKFGLSEIPIRWHNLFLENSKLSKFIMDETNLGIRYNYNELLDRYFFATRCLAPAINPQHTWDNNFNTLIMNKENNFFHYQNCSRIVSILYQKCSCKGHREPYREIISDEKSYI